MRFKLTVTQIATAAKSLSMIELVMYDSSKTIIEYPTGTTATYTSNSKTGDCTKFVNNNLTDFYNVSWSDTGARAGLAEIVIELPSAINPSYFRICNATPSYAPTAFTLSKYDETTQTYTEVASGTQAVPSKSGSYSGYVAIDKYVTVTVVDAYYKSNGTFDHQTTRATVTNKNSVTYSYDALTVDKYDVTSADHVEGTTTDDLTITFTYKAWATITLNVVDKYYLTDGSFEKSSTRSSQTSYDPIPYTVQALYDSDYAVTSATEYSGTATTDTTLTFTYQKLKTIIITITDTYYDKDGAFERVDTRRKIPYKANSVDYSFAALTLVGYTVTSQTPLSGTTTESITLNFNYKARDIEPVVDDYKAGVFNVMALNSGFEVLALLRYTNLQWSRKYRESGTFSIQIPLEQYDPNIKYIYTKSRPEVGKVTQVNYQESNGYRSISMSGYFLEEELNRHIAYKPGTTNITNAPSWTLQSGKAEGVAYAFFDAFKTINGKNVDGTTWSSALGMVSGTSQGRGVQAEHHRNGEYLGHKIYLILKASGMSYRVRYDFESNRRTFEVWQGLDRTQSNSYGNNPAIFSTRYGNIKNPNIVIDDSTYKNAAIVTNEYVLNDDSDYTIEAYNDPSDTDTERAFVAVDSSLNKSDFTASAFKSALENEGQNEVANAEQTINLDFDAIAGTYEYLADFDLGDLCSIEIPEIGLSADARLIGCYEVIKSGDWSLSLEFGTPILR